MPLTIAYWLWKYIQLFHFLSSRYLQRPSIWCQRKSHSFRLNQTYFWHNSLFPSPDMRRILAWAVHLPEKLRTGNPLLQEFVVLTENLEIEGHVWRQSIWWGGYVTENKCWDDGSQYPLPFVLFLPYTCLVLFTYFLIPPLHHSRIPERATICLTPVLLPFPVTCIVSRSYISTEYCTTHFSLTPARFLTHRRHFQYIYTSFVPLTYQHNTSSLVKRTFTLKEQLNGSCLPCTIFTI